MSITGQASFASKDVARAASVLPGGCLGGFRLPDDLACVVSRASGAYLWDTDGRRYVDHVLGAGPMILGHAHPAVVEAIRRQAELGTTYYTLNEPAIELAELITQLLPCAEAVKFVGSGSEATFVALRLARAFTGRPHVLKFEGGYHGNHDYAQQSVTSVREGRGTEPVTESAGIPRAIGESVLVADFNDLEGAEAVVREHGRELAAVIVEPVQRALLPEPGFLEGLRRLCDESGALLVFDEVVTAFRVALGGAQELFGVIPDLAAIGKVLGGGLPLAAVVGRADVLDRATPLHGQSARSNQVVCLTGTLNGNPLAAAAGRATLLTLQQEEGVYESIHAAGRLLWDGIEEIAERLGIPLRPIGLPVVIDLVHGADSVTDYRTFANTDRARIVELKLGLVRRGVFVNPWARFYVSSAHGTSEIDQTLTALEAAAQEAFA